MVESRFRKLVGKDDLKKRTEESYATKDDSGKFRSYISSTMPLKQWKADDGDHVIDIIPFITSEKNINKLPAGTGAHKVEVYVHFGIGMNENAYVCPSLTMGKDCPICEYRNAMRKQDNYDEVAYKALAPKRRVVYNICCYDSTKDKSSGVMYWETSFHLSEKNIVAIAKNKRTGEFIEFADPDVGKTIEFSKVGKGLNTSYEGFKFLDRDEIISDETLDKAVDPSDYIDVLSYDELCVIFDGEASVAKKEIPKRPEVKKEVIEEEQNDELPFNNGSEKLEAVSEPEDAVPTRRRRTESLESNVEAAKAEEPSAEERPNRLRRRRA